VKRSRLCLGALLVTSVAAGALESSPIPRDGGLGRSTIFLVFATQALIYWWCRFDIFERGLEYPGGAPLLAAFFAPIGVPAYFFRTRPWPRALGATCLAVLFYCACSFLLGLSNVLRTRFI